MKTLAGDLRSATRELFDELRMCDTPEEDLEFRRILGELTRSIDELEQLEHRIWHGPRA